MLTDPAAGLRDAPLLFLFIETSDLERQRTLLEGVLGLPVIENQFHPPHHRHGLVKYDAGEVILALNLCAPRRFLADESDALVAVFRVGWDGPTLAGRLRACGFDGPADPRRRRFTDPDGHHYDFHTDPTDRPGATVQELRLTVQDLSAVQEFYTRVLGLEALDRTDQSLRCATGTVDLVVERGVAAADGRRLRWDSYLPVFHTPDIHQAHEALLRRGLEFLGERPKFSQIGGTVRFADPSGQTFCLYEPSAESLTWGSGPKVLELATAPAASR